MLEATAQDEVPAVPRHEDPRGPVIEWAPFQIRAGIDEARLLAASARLQAEFLARQEGFIRRELIRRGPGDYVDLVWWRTPEAARDAMAEVAASTACRQYFALMGTNDSGAGDGVEHFQSIGTYPAAR